MREFLRQVKGALAAAITGESKRWLEVDFWQTATFVDVQTALDKGADPHARAKNGRTPLHYASTYNTLKVVTALLEAGADPIARAKDGRTPLHGAAGFNANPAVVTALLAAGAALEARAEVGLTYGYFPSQAGGVIPEARSGVGPTPLHYAAEFNNNPAVVRTLLAAGATLEARAGAGVTPLHYAAAYNGPKVVTALLEGGATLEARTRMGMTPLHYAAKYSNDPAVVINLLAAGADTKAKTADGKTAFDLIQENEKLKDSAAYWRLNDLQYE